MYQATINPNASSSLPTSPPPFTPPNFAIWVNALWFLSLVISITCALLATLLQQWARRYLKVTQPRYSPHRRARIRAFFAEGVDRFLLPWAVEALPTMLHLSLFLFFAGLAVFLWNVNLTIFKLVLSWVGLCTALYGCITLVPIFRHDSPYHTPLSLPTWHIVTGIRVVTFRVLQFFATFPCFSYATYYRFQNMAKRYRKLLVQGMRKTAEETAFGSPSEIDTRAFLWTFDSLDEDHELERFFSGLPGFRSSKVVKDPLPDLTSEQHEKLLNAWVGLLDRTSSSDLLPEPAKIRRTVICAKAIGPAGVPGAIKKLVNIILVRDFFGPTEIARFFRDWADGQDQVTTTITRAICSSVIARAQRRDDHWFAMASDELGVPEYVLRNHATHKNDLSLVILIHVVRQQLSRFFEEGWPLAAFSSVLFAASKFDVLDTSPELQHEFCALWNQVTRMPHWIYAWYILSPVRNVYITLHLHTDSAPTAFSASTDDEDHILSELSSYPLCKIPGHHPDTDTSAQTMPLVPPETSPLLTLVFRTDEYSLQDIADPVYSSASEILSTASPEPAPDDSTGPSLSPTLMIDFPRSSSLLESHFSILATTPPGASPSPPFSPEIGAAEGGPEASLHEDKDALDPPSANHAIQATTMTILDRPPLPTLPSAACVTIASLSQQGWIRT
jgi:hypothetical protein